jgi:hypothetical protein
MTNKYNFDEINVNERPEIIMGGTTYLLRYPTLEEVEELQKLKTPEEQTDKMYSFIEKTDDDQPDFKLVLRKQDIRIVKAFSEMLKKEFGVGE